MALWQILSKIIKMIEIMAHNMAKCKGELGRVEGEVVKKYCVKFTYLQNPVGIQQSFCHLF
jgi:hypothetical protein